MQNTRRPGFAHKRWVHSLDGSRLYSCGYTRQNPAALGTIHIDCGSHGFEFPLKGMACPTGRGCKIDPMCPHTRLSGRRNTLVEDRVGVGVIPKSAALKVNVVKEMRMFSKLMRGGLSQPFYVHGIFSGRGGLSKSSTVKTRASEGHTRQSQP